MFSLLLLWSCRAGSTQAVSVELNKLPYQQLSDYHFFTGQLKSLTANNRVIPYELKMPLFSDYAHKARYVWMPEGSQAAVASDGSVEFPNGSVIIKNFYYPTDFRKPELNHDMVETRLLVKFPEKWEAYTYVWNEQETDAKLKLVGDQQSVAWTDVEGNAQQVKYVVPNKNQCKGCHLKGKELVPIGPQVRNLDREFSYADTTMNQLAYWQMKGFLEKIPEGEYGHLANWKDEEADVEHKAISYLEVNCGHCHSPDGGAFTTGLYLRTEVKEKLQLGFCKTPVAAGKGSGGMAHAIQPGQPEESFLLFRMKSGDPGVMMPELGRNVLHKEGIELIEKWIAGLDPHCD